MKTLVIIARVALGLVFLFFGSNNFLQFIPPPADMTPAAERFLVALKDSGYVMPILSGLQVAIGAMLVSGVFVPLALVLLAPIMVNIVGFHVMIDRKGLEFVIGLTAIGLFLAFAYRDSFAGVLRPLARPTGVE